MKRTSSLLLIFCSFSANASGIADWQFDENGLPAVTYRGDYPYEPSEESLKIGVMHTGDLSDPYFLLGNYRMVLFAHVSGKYQVLSSERIWSRLNLGASINTGVSGAWIDVDGERLRLTGPGSLAEDRAHTEFRSGVGYATYRYETGGLTVERTIKVAPSASYDSGQSTFLIDVTIHNPTDTEKEVSYREFVAANYEMNWHSRNPVKVDYSADIELVDRQTIKAAFRAAPREPYLWKDKDSIAIYEGYPPALYLHISGADASVDSSVDADGVPLLEATRTLSMPGNSSATIVFAVGFNFENDDSLFRESAGELRGSDHADQWKAVLPQFEDEPDQVLRRELIWHAHILEAMSAYSAYFNETKTPQGTNYDYYWGQHASIRDHLQHMLPMAYYNPAVAKSALRYSLQKVMPMGGVPIVELGFGYQTNLFYEQSDNQLFLLNSINEYLRITGDYEFLEEIVAYYPREAGMAGTVLEHIDRMHVFLRHEIRTGPRGLVRLLNSDWNDDLHFVLDELPYNLFFMRSESLLNTTMLVKVYGDLADHLTTYRNGADTEASQARHLEQLIADIRDYRRQVFEALLRDWGDEPFIRRFYLGDRSVGHDKVYIWPQAFALQIPELPLDRKQKIVDVVEERLVRPEKVGGRLMEEVLPTERTHYCLPGMGENGAFWFSPYGQYVLGVAEVDLERAWRYFHRSSLGHIGSQFPGLWIGQWTAGDSVNSSLSESPGHARHMMYNAHPHAYQLYMYFRLKEIGQERAVADAP